MKINKRLLTAGLITAIAVLAVAASSASAAVWKHKGVNLAKHTEIALTGAEIFETGTYGMDCEITATITTSGGSTGTISKYSNVKCEKGFGELLGCTVTSTEPKSLPWAVDVNATDLTVTNWKVKRTFNAGCKISSIEKTVGNVTVTLDNAAEISSGEIAGQITGYKIFGSFTINAPNALTYGIG